MYYKLFFLKKTQKNAFTQLFFMFFNKPLFFSKKIGYKDKNYGDLTMQKYELTPEQIYTKSVLADKDIENLPRTSPILGQDSALEAINFGVQMKASGYNIFCTGPKGVGRTTLTIQSVKEFAAKQKTPDDWCFVHNFEIPHQPIASNFPAGSGKTFVKDIKKMVTALKMHLPALFADEAYKIQVAHIEQQCSREKESYFEKLQTVVETDNVTIMRLPAGVAVAPVKNGKVLTPKTFNKLPKAERKDILEQLKEAQQRLEDTIKEIPNWEATQQQMLEQLHTDMANKVLKSVMTPIYKSYAKSSVITSYLDAIKQDILDNIAFFVVQPNETNIEMITEQLTALWNRYAVNLFVSHKAGAGAPVVHLNHPTLSNLVGKIERQQHLGSLITDFSLIRAGALHQANGGYLIIEARELIENEYVWNALKRSLFSKEIKMESGTDDNSISGVVSLMPAIIPLSIKVILIGETGLYYALMDRDDEFGELFKIQSRFAEKMERTKETEKVYAQILINFARNEKLKTFSHNAIRRILEYAARLSGDCYHLSTFMTHVNDLMREASFFATKKRSKQVEPIHIEEALHAKRKRSGAMQKEILDMMHRGTIDITTRGHKVGQLNALVVHDYGSFSFGRPNRVTCQVHLGHGDLIDVEREVELGGALHSKGVLILSSFLAARFSKGLPLSLDASLVFEQSYSELDGDSASSTELYCLLSAVGDLPLNQSIAVTGSVNQLGQVQAVGAVNEKIEGYFTVCQKQGLTGEQGVIIPASTVHNLMLAPEVVKAVEDGKFHIYAVNTIDEGMEILTGKSAGQLNKNGQYPATSINGIIAKRLEEFFQKSQQTDLKNKKKVKK